MDKIAWKMKTMHYGKKQGSEDECKVNVLKGTFANKRL